MPFYDYECSNNHRFELKQSFTAATVATCPTCNKPARRLINLVPVHFKGSGFYVNDYGRKDAASTSETPKKTAETNGTANGKDAKAPEAKKAAETPKASKESKESKESAGTVSEKS